MFSAAAPVYAQTKVENETVTTPDVLTQDEFTYDFQGTKNEVKTVEDSRTLTTTVKTGKRIEEFKTDKATGHISVTSDYLTDTEIKDYEKVVNDIASQLDGQVDDTALAGNQFNTSRLATSDNFNIQKRSENGIGQNGTM